MGLRKWVASGLRVATSWVPGLGTAVEEGLDHWNERLERRSVLASLPRPYAGASTSFRSRVS